MWRLKTQVGSKHWHLQKNNVYLKYLTSGVILGDGCKLLLPVKDYKAGEIVCRMVLANEQFCLTLNITGLDAEFMEIHSELVADGNKPVFVKSVILAGPDGCERDGAVELDGPCQSYRVLSTDRYKLAGSRPLAMKAL